MRPRPVCAYAQTTEVREAILRAAQMGGLDVRFATHVTELAPASRNRSISVVVWELGPTAELETREIAQHVGRQEGVSVVVRIDLSRCAARKVLALAHSLPNARLSLAGHDDLCRDVLAAAGEVANGSPHLIIAQRLLPLSKHPARDILATAIVAGDARIDVRAFARLCAHPLRTIEWRLRAGGLPPTRNLLAWMVSLHSLWLMEIHGWSAKRTADAAGFSSCEAWGNYVARNTGARPSAVMRDGGFVGLLDRCVAYFTTFMRSRSCRSVLDGPW